MIIRYHQLARSQDCYDAPDRRTARVRSDPGLMRSWRGRHDRRLEVAESTPIGVKSSIVDSIGHTLPRKTYSSDTRPTVLRDPVGQVKRPRRSPDRVATLHLPLPHPAWPFASAPLFPSPSTRALCIAFGQSPVTPNTAFGLPGTHADTRPGLDARRVPWWPIGLAVMPQALSKRMSARRDA
jgi:hypothetical protein